MRQRNKIVSEFFIRKIASIVLNKANQVFFRKHVNSSMFSDVTKIQTYFLILPSLHIESNEIPSEVFLSLRFISQGLHKDMLLP